jgi:hypothetical protein
MLLPNSWSISLYAPETHHSFSPQIQVLNLEGRDSRSMAFGFLMVRSPWEIRRLLAFQVSNTFNELCTKRALENLGHDGQVSRKSDECQARWLETMVIPSSRKHVQGN